MPPSGSLTRNLSAVAFAAVAGTFAFDGTAQEASDAPSVVVTEAALRDVAPSFTYVGRVEAFELFLRADSQADGNLDQIENAKAHRESPSKGDGDA